MRMWLLAAICLLVLPFLQGCAAVADMAGIEIGPMVSRMVSYSGKYCEVDADVRATIRSDANHQLALELGDQAWVFLHCPGDAPTPTSWRP